VKEKSSWNRETSESKAAKSEELSELHAAHGAGPLLQRDYWARIEKPKFSPEEIIDLLAHEFPRFAEVRIADFSFVHIPPLKVGSEMNIHILGYGNCHVRVSELAARTLTLITLEDHYEAGRITFGALPKKDDSIIFRIRSRARSRSKSHSLSFRLMGHLCQKRMWEQFLRNVVVDCEAETAAKTTKDVDVHEETHEVAEEAVDEGEDAAPTLMF